MKIILYMLKKEFRQIFRNRPIVGIIFVAPVLQLIILSSAATFEIKNLRIYFNDFDQSTYSMRLKNAFTRTDHFIRAGESMERVRAEEALEKDEADLICEIPKNFERDLYVRGRAGVFLKINAINGTKAGVGINYSQSTIRSFAMDISGEVLAAKSGPSMIEIPKAVRIDYLNWYNEKLDYKTYMVPGLLVLLVTLVGGFLSSMNVVREKEMGTIEQINVTPIRKHQFIIGKLLPFWVLGLVVFTIGLITNKLVFNIPIVGSLVVIYGFTMVYLLAVLGIGLFISTITETQQQAMFISWFFFFIFILMSGLFTAIENMPVWAQRVTLFNPLRYFMEVIRMVLLKGSGFNEVREHFIIISGFAIFINAFAVWRYRKIA